MVRGGFGHTNNIPAHVRMHDDRPAIEFTIISRNANMVGRAIRTVYIMSVSRYSHASKPPCKLTVRRSSLCFGTGSQSYNTLGLVTNFFLRI